MRIVIAGEGETGTHLAATLSVENQDIVLIGRDSRRLAEIESACNLITVCGSALSASDLGRCGIADADLFVAVTDDENRNLLAAQIARGCGAKRCVARVDNPDFFEPEAEAVFGRNGVDALLYPERLAALEIVGFIGQNWLRDRFDVHYGKLMVAGVRIGKDSALTGLALRDAVTGPRFFHVCAVRRADEIMIPRGDTAIRSDDTLYFTVLPENISALCGICGGRQQRIRKIMISGGGRVTENLLRYIHSDYDITVIESDEERCRYIASRFGSVTVVNTRANDIATLREEGLAACDMFLALTGSSEKNIVSCMVAREHGVGKTVARIEEMQFIPEAESLSIDKIVNKKLLNVSKILDSLVETDFDQAQCMLLDHAEIIKLIAHEGSRIVSRPISELQLPRDITIGGLVRDGRGMLVEGRTRIIPGDHVLVFCRIGSLPKVERLFR